MTIVNLALPVMQAEMTASFQSMQWVVEAYVLMLCALMLTGGGLADAFGRRRILLLGASIFLVASVAAALAATAEWLIAARALQGVGGALLAPASLALVSSGFAPAERGKALGLWAAFSGIATAFAPPLGGLLIEWSSWRAVFYINVPILAVVLLFAPLKLKRAANNARRTRRLAGGGIGRRHAAAADLCAHTCRRVWHERWLGMAQRRAQPWRRYRFYLLGTPGVNADAAARNLQVPRLQRPQRHDHCDLHGHRNGHVFSANGSDAGVPLLACGGRFGVGPVNGCNVRVGTVVRQVR